MRDSGEIEQFVALVRSYCSWVESPADDTKSDARKAMEFIPRLYAGALQLPQCYGDEDSIEIPHDQWKGRFERFAHLPLRNYSVCFNPIEIPAKESVVGDIADDLADIWQDLKGGLTQYDSGLTDAAIWEWRYLFQTHWGHHASSAMYALHSWSMEHEDVWD